jgi:PAS domain S-box-containing protein
MEDERKTKEELMEELIDLRKRNDELEASIKELKQTEKKRSESEEKFRTLFEGAAEGILVADIESRKFLYANPAICKMLGYTEVELTGMGVADIHPKDSLEHVISEFDALGRGEKVLVKNIPCLRKDGAVVYADINTAKGLIGGEKCNVAFFTDVTEQRRMDEELRDSEQRLKKSEYRYRILVENLPQKIFLKNKDSVYISCNENYARDLKIKPDKIAGKTDYDFYPKELADKYRADDKRIMASGKIEDIEEKYIQDGQEAWVHTVKTPVKDENGNIVSILGIFWDITESRQAAEKLKVSLEEKEVLLKEIHHRVKNNMQIISSLLRLQAANIKDEKIHEVFNEVHGRIRSMSLLYEMLYQSKDLARVDFAEYIKRLTSHLISMHKAKMTAPSLRLGVSDVHLDIKRAIPCGLIITELISNSLKHAFPNGKKGEIVVEMHPNKGEKYRLVVSDNGVGFPEGLDFRQTKSLGMRLVVDLVSQLNGTIELRREKGTEFRIEF